MTGHGVEDDQQSDGEVTYHDLQMNAAYRLGRNNDRVREVNQADDDSVRTPDTVSVAGARSLKGRRDGRHRTSFADVVSSKASAHGAMRAARSPTKKHFQQETQDYPENLSSHSRSVQQKSVRRGRSPLREAPKAPALALRLAEHYAESAQSPASGVRELQQVRPSSPRKEPSSSRKPPFVPPLALHPSPPQISPTHKQASDGLDEFSQRVVEVPKYIDDEGEVDEGFDQNEGIGIASYKMEIRGEPFNSKMKWY